MKQKFFGNKNSRRVGLFLAYRQIKRASLWTTSLIIAVMTLTFLNLVVVNGVLVGLIESSVQAQRERISELADSELHALVADARVAFGRRATDTFHIERAVRTELTQRAEQPEPGHDATAATQETIATDTGVGEEEAAS